MNKALRATTFVVSLTIAALFGLTSGMGNISAQSPTDYDTDNNRLIEIAHLEQLDAIRWDLNGDGVADTPANADAYAAAFPSADEGMGCPENHCEGYELTRSLDFNDASSYASGAVNAAWMQGNGWLPIGGLYPSGGSARFNSLFEGNNHTIANLFIDYISSDVSGKRVVAGLFGENTGEISRIGVVDVNMNVNVNANSKAMGGDTHIGGLVGINNGNVLSSYATGGVSGHSYVGALVGHNGGDITFSYATSKVEGDYWVGGLAGTNSGSITFSYATGSVTSEAVFGGLVGGNSGSIISSHATGNVTGDYPAEQGLIGGFAGGLVGINYGDEGNITSSYATGKVTGNDFSGGLVGTNDGSIISSYATGSIRGWRNIGGLVGTNSGSIISSHATNSVVGESFSGGLVGHNHEGSITSSYATGNVVGMKWYWDVGGGITRFYTSDSATRSNLGGLVGSNDGSITSSYAAGSVSGYRNIGGLVGISEGGSITFSYATSNVSGDSHIAIGGLIGKIIEGDIRNSYWDVQTSMQSIGVGEGITAGVEGKTTAELQTPTDYTGIYANWHTDIDNADYDSNPTTGKEDFWNFGTSDDYPLLKVDLVGDETPTSWEFGEQHGNRLMPTPDPDSPPSADAPAGGGCNSAGARMPMGATAGNLLALIAPLVGLAGIRQARAYRAQ